VRKFHGLLGKVHFIPWIDRSFSWDMKVSQEKFKTMPMQILGERCIMGFVQVENQRIAKHLLVKVT